MQSSVVQYRYNEALCKAVEYENIVDVDGVHNNTVEHAEHSRAQ